MINYIDARNFGMKRVTLMSCVVQYMPAALLYSTLLDQILCLYYLVRLIFFMLSVSPPSHKHVGPEKLCSMCFLHTRRLIVTTVRGSLVPPEKLNYYYQTSDYYQWGNYVGLY